MADTMIPIPTQQLLEGALTMHRYRTLMSRKQDRQRVSVLTRLDGRSQLYPSDSQVHWLRHPNGWHRALALPNEESYIKMHLLLGIL